VATVEDCGCNVPDIDLMTCAGRLYNPFKHEHFRENINVIFYLRAIFIDESDARGKVALTDLKCVFNYVFIY